MLAARDLTGQVDGVIDTFTTPEAFTAISLIVDLQGVRVNESEVTVLSSTQFRLSSPPELGDSLQVAYDVVEPVAYTIFPPP